MKKFLVFLFAVFAMLAAYAAELDGLIDARAELWKMSGQTVMKNYPDLFVWMDQGRTRLRYNVRENRAPLTLFGRRVLEVIIDVKDEKISELNVSVYNRGDAGEMPKKTFDALLDAVENRLAGFAGRENVPQTQNVSVEGSRIRSKVWRTDAYDVVMRWSYTRSVPEFLAIDFFPAGGAPKSLREGLKTTVATSELDKRLINDEDGSRYMTVPMVDQGAKGYCVAATVERILRYYGSNIDQHMIAKLAESDAQRGTNINKIVEVLEGNQIKLGIRYRKLYQYNDLYTYSDFKGMINSYNTIARRMKLKKIDFNDYVYIVDRTKYLSYGALMKSLDFKVFRELRKKDKGDNRDFLEAVKENIDEGIPLCWSTFIFPGVGGSGGSEFGMHMRIIIGYNTKTGEIIYSDSWGAEHEKKVMKPEDAWGITVNLIALEPRRRNAK